MASGNNDAVRPAEGVWRSRSLLSLGIRVLVIGVPVLVASLVGRLVLQLLPADHGLLGAALALGAAVVVSILLGRWTSRMLPLAVLLKMTMIFPDRAPNRVKVARRASSKEELAHRLEHPDPDARETAMTLLALVTALGRHDRKTRGHSERVRLYCDLVGEELGLNAAERGRLRWVGLLHDIGKLEVAADVLNKPGKLTDEEWDAVRTHPHTGAQLAEPLAEWLGPWFEGIEHHHERYDGSGYPNGHAGEQISLAGRAVSVVDAFETMTAARSYKSPMSTAAARAELTRCAGSHFDPAIVRAFLAISLPRLLWTMGPLTFLVNFPFLRWIPTTSSRMVDVAAAGANGAATAVGATAVTMAVVTSPVVTAPSHSHDHVHVQLASDERSAHRLVAGAGSSTAGSSTGSATVGTSPTRSTAPNPAARNPAASNPAAPNPAASNPALTDPSATQPGGAGPTGTPSATQAPAQAQGAPGSAATGTTDGTPAPSASADPDPGSESQPGGSSDPAKPSKPIKDPKPKDPKPKDPKPHDPPTKVTPPKAPPPTKAPPPKAPPPVKAPPPGNHGPGNNGNGHGIGHGGEGNPGSHGHGKPHG